MIFSPWRIEFLRSRAWVTPTEPQQHKLHQLTCHRSEHFNHSYVQIFHLCIYMCLFVLPSFESNEKRGFSLNTKYFWGLSLYRPADESPCQEGRLSVCGAAFLMALFAFTCDKTHTIHSHGICFGLNFGLEKDTVMYPTPSSFCSQSKPVGSHITSLTAHSGPIRLIKGIKDWEGFYETQCLKVGYFPQIFNSLLGSFKGRVLPC